MTGWNKWYNWTYEQVECAIDKELEIYNQDYVCLDVSHSDRKNMDDIIQWVNELGYRAEEINCDLIKVWKK